MQLPDGTILRPVNFSTGSEPWTDYLLDDGSVLKIRLVVTEIFVVEGRADDLGRPIHQVNGQTLTVVVVAE